VKPFFSEFFSQNGKLLPENKSLKLGDHPTRGLSQIWLT